jgi:hypothetical protein
MHPRLAPLGIAFPALNNNQRLEELGAIAATQVHGVLQAATQDINVERFIAALPITGPINSAALARALDAGLNTGAALTDLENADTDNVRTTLLPNIINNGAEAINTLGAQRRLHPLLTNTRLAALGATLRALTASQAVSTAINAINRELNVDNFIQGLANIPPTTSLELAAALDAGLTGNAFTTRHAGGDQQLFANIIAAGTPQLWEELRAFQRLHLLRTDQRFGERFRSALNALAEVPAIAHAIATNATQNINIDAFITALNPPPNGANIAAALDSGLGIAGGGANSLTTLYATSPDAFTAVSTEAANDVQTANRLAALHRLGALRTDLLFPQLLRDNLNALAIDAHTSPVIALAAQNINIDAFIAALPDRTIALDGRLLAQALDSGLGTANTLRTLYSTQNAALNAAAQNINNSAQTIGSLRALHRLGPLRTDPRFRVLKASLDALAANANIYAAIAGARRNIDVDAFIAALPVPPIVPNAAQLADALDAGLQTQVGNALNTLANGAHAQLFTDVITAATNPPAQTIPTLHALYRLRALRTNPDYFNHLKDTLSALAEHAVIGPAIAAATRDIDLPAFIAALPPQGQLNGQTLATALDRGLGINTLAGLYANHADLFNNAATENQATITLQALRRLLPLRNDRRFVALQGSLDALANHPEISRAIAGGREINVDAFITALPTAGNPPIISPIELATALDAGLSTNTNALTALATQNAALFTDIITAANGGGLTMSTLQALRRLEPLRADPRFTELKGALSALAEHQSIGPAIAATAGVINVKDFITLLSSRGHPHTITGVALANALDAGFGIDPTTRGSLTHLENTNPNNTEMPAFARVTTTHADTTTRLQALARLEPLCADPRFAQLRDTLSELTKEPGISATIVSGAQNFSVAQFVTALPPHPAIPDAAAIAAALDAGLQANNALTTLYNAADAAARGAAGAGRDAAQAKQTLFAKVALAVKVSRAATNQDDLIAAMNELGLNTNDPAEVMRTLTSNRDAKYAEITNANYVNQAGANHFTNAQQTFKDTDLSRRNADEQYLASVQERLPRIQDSLDRNTSAREAKQIDEKLTQMKLNLLQYQAELNAVISACDDPRFVPGVYHQDFNRLVIPIRASMAQGRMAPRDELGETLSDVTRVLQSIEAEMLITNAILSRNPAAAPNQIAYGNRRNPRSIQEEGGFAGRDLAAAQRHVQTILGNPNPFIAPAGGVAHGAAAPMNYSDAADTIRTVRVESTNQAGVTVTGAAIVTHDTAKKSSAASFFFNETDFALFENETRRNSYASLSHTSIPGRLAMGWAQKVMVEYFLPTIHDRSVPLIFTRGKLPKCCIEALMIICEVNNIKYIQPDGFKFSPKEMNAKAKLFKKIVLEELRQPEILPPSDVNRRGPGP